MVAFKVMFAGALWGVLLYWGLWVVSCLFEFGGVWSTF